ncbi:hypothetical protein Bbelb_111280 [Branchiostoma belcheri]|nr:hypothetical protein Bbelb_111280 [Branchiostoma belcheri]
MRALPPWVRYRTHCLDKGTWTFNYKDLQLHAWWDGFFDRESGVQFYQYTFANRCLGEDEFSIPQPQQIHNTTGKFASWTAPAAGTYFCTVVAYNPALAPSQPACSDGITVDASPPSVRHVRLTGFYARPGLVSDDGGNVWIVNKNGEREIVTDLPESCRNASSLVEDIELWPIAEPPYKRNTTSQNCTELGPLPDMGYLPMENHLHVQWEGWDAESGIADSEVDLSSTKSATVSPDIHPYTSTKSHPELRLYHPNLAQGALFYIVVRATNRALLSTTKVFGPVTVDITPPVIETPINVTHMTVNSVDFLVAVWLEGSIYDTEDLDPPDIDHQTNQSEIRCRWFGFEHAYQDISYLAGVGSAPGLDDVVPLELIGSSTSHVFTGLSLEHFQSGRVAQSVARSAHTQEVAGSNPAHVTDLVPLGKALNTTFLTLLRMDPECDKMQTITGVMWSSHRAPHLDPDGRRKAETAAKRLYFYRYYVTVVARTEAGEVNATSDGVAVLPQDRELAGATVSDESCHTPILFNQSLLTHHTSTPFPGSCADDVDFQSSTTTVHTYWSVPEPMEDFLQLSPGGHYRSALHFCHQDGCFQPTVSDGFWVTSEPPVPNEIHGSEALQTTAMGGYEWTLAVSEKESSGLGTVLYPWQPIVDLERSGQNITATVALPNPLEFTTCIKLLLRGKNKAGLSSVTSLEIHDCNDPGSVNIQDPVVFDAVPDFNEYWRETSDGISLATNHFWTAPDQDFTRSRDTLAAAWPSLRHGDYYWKVLSADSIECWSYQRHGNEINYHSFRCDEPETLRCGQTKEKTLEYEKFEQVAEEVSVCSNGVVVDTEPPVAGEVHVGWGNQNYQTFTTELPIVWESFRDVEVHGNTGHQHSGVMKYEYAIACTMSTEIRFVEFSKKERRNGLGSLVKKGGKL